MFKKYILLLTVSLFFASCANQSLLIMEKKRTEHYIGMMNVYEDALLACQKELIDKEQQFIDEQMKNYLIINVFAKSTGKSQKEVMNSSLLSYNEMNEYYNLFANERKKSVLEIKEIFEKWDKKVNNEIEKASALDEAILEVKEKRAENRRKISKDILSILTAIGISAAIIQ